jgi:hydroxymethylglutaryl-CoA reductase
LKVSVSYIWFMNKHRNSQIPKFYKRSLFERREIIKQWIDDDIDVDDLLDSGLSLDQAVSMIENVIGVYGLPFGVATNFLINQKDYLIPMIVEEPSVIAAASNAAKMFREGGGFRTSSDEPVMIGQIQVLDVSDLFEAEQAVVNAKSRLLDKVGLIGGSIVKRGGGARDIEVRSFPQTAVGDMLVVHLLYDTRDAMGANAVNTAVELIAEDVGELTGGRVNLKILSNLSDRRKARAEGIVPADVLAMDHLDGRSVVQAIVEAGVFAEVDPYRATTHNKGIMNGIDAVVLATGNDWRAVEAGSHAFVARDRSYTSMTTWRVTDNGDLHGSIELPMALGIVGGATRVHPLAQLALKILDVESARELAEVVVAVGLAQNFAAMRALATEGIQRGHMRMHARQIAIAAGATPEQVPVVVDQMVREDNIRLERAKTIVNELQETR